MVYNSSVVINMETQEERKKWNKESDELTKERIDTLDESQCKIVLKYLIDKASHNKNGEPVLLVWNHEVINFDDNMDCFKEMDCFIHTFIDAMEIAEGK